MAYPYEVLEQEIVVNDTVGGKPVVVVWTASALDDPSIAQGRDIGSVVAYSRHLGDRILNFSAPDGFLTDQETGSTWNLLGQAVTGLLEGEFLSPVVSIKHFWFPWAAFRPDTRIYANDE